MKYDELIKYLCECCKNNVPIAYESLKREIKENKEDIECDDFREITNRWRRSSFYFNRKRKLFKFTDVYSAEIYKKGTCDNANAIMFYMVPVEPDTCTEVYILGVCKHPWSYDLKALNIEQFNSKTYVTEIKTSKKGGTQFV